MLRHKDTVAHSLEAPGINENSKISISKYKRNK